MSDLKTIIFKRQHFDLLELRDREKEVVGNEAMLQAKLAYLESNNSAQTLIYKGVLLGVAGFVEMRPGVMELFLFPSKYIKHHKVAFGRIMRYYIRKALPHYSWHRLQLTTVADDFHIRWASFLDFQKEGILKKYGHNGEDHIMWSIVR